MFSICRILPDLKIRIKQWNVKRQKLQKNNEFPFISEIPLPLKVQSHLRKVRTKRKGAWCLDLQVWAGNDRPTDPTCPCGTGNTPGSAAWPCRRGRRAGSWPHRGPRSSGHSLGSKGERDRRSASTRCGSSRQPPLPPPPTPPPFFEAQLPRRKGHEQAPSLQALLLKTRHTLESSLGRWVTGWVSRAMWRPDLKHADRCLCRNGYHISPHAHVPWAALTSLEHEKAGSQSLDCHGANELGRTCSADEAPFGYQSAWIPCGWHRNPQTGRPCYS